MTRLLAILAFLLFVLREQLVQLLVAPPSILTISVDFAGKPVKTKLCKAMELPGSNFHEIEVTIQPGEYRVMT